MIVTHELTLTTTQQPPVGLDAEHQRSQSITLPFAGSCDAFSSVYPSLWLLSLYWFAYPGPSLRALVLYLEDLRKPFVINAIPAVCILIIKTTCTWLVQDTVTVCVFKNALRYWYLANTERAVFYFPFLVKKEINVTFLFMSIICLVFELHTKLV